MTAPDWGREPGAPAPPPDHHRPGRARPAARNRRSVVAGVAVFLALGASGTLLLGSGAKDKAASQAKDPGATAAIVQGDLTVTADVGGTLGYTGTGSVFAQAPDAGVGASPDKGGAGTSPGGGQPSGNPPGGPSPSTPPKDGGKKDAVDDQATGTQIFTGLPKVGDTVKQGEPVYRVNGRPIPLFYGDAPLWRALSKGVSNGVDIRVLKKNLAALGHGKDLQLDDRFTDGTEAAVKHWQKALGLPQTGKVDPSAVVVQPGAVRVTTVKALVGAPAQGEVATVSGTGRQVTVELPVDKQSLAKQGDTVSVRLPDGKTTTGTITSIGTVATQENQNGSTGGKDKATIQVIVTLDKPEEAGSLDGAPVSVGFTSQSRKGVLSVPVNALVALAEGGYAVEVVDTSNNRHLVAVKPGLFANGRVEITGDGLAKDQKVRVPSS